MRKLLGITILSGMMASAYAQSDVREAVRWEHAKERAAARQAASEREGKYEGSPQAAIRFERSKERAAARQARIETRGENSQNTVTASGRMKSNR